VEPVRFSAEAEVFELSFKIIAYDPLKRVGIGTSVLGTSEAVGIEFV